MKWKRVLLAVLAVQAVGFLLLLFLATGDDPEARAIATMALGLVAIWVIGFGTVNVIWLDRLTGWLARLPGRWEVRFVLGCTVLALLEEAVATGMTNLVRHTSDEPGDAMITASTNYLEVVGLHSVVVFVPMFAAWAWMLRRWRFSPFSGLLCFGMTGMLVEMASSGPAQILGFGQWILIYGLMIYAPLVVAQTDTGTGRPRWRYVVAVVLPIAVAIPVALGVLGIHALL